MKPFRELVTLFRPNPTPEQKAKVIYYAMLILGKPLIQDIIDSTPDEFRAEFKDNAEFKKFIADELGVIMYVICLREGYQWFDTMAERKSYGVMLTSLFRYHLKTPWDTVELYVETGFDEKEPDQIFVRTFSSRIIAFLRKDLQSLNNREYSMVYSNQLDALIYAGLYTNIFCLIARTLNEYIGDSSKPKEIIRAAKLFDKEYST